jgi:hypothetical protein
MDNNSHLAIGLANEYIEDIDSLATMEPGVVFALHCLQPSGPAPSTTDNWDQEEAETLLKAYHTGMLNCFIAYIKWRDSPDNPSPPIADNWTAITRAEFRAFRIGPDFDPSAARRALHYQTPAPPAPGVNAMPIL